MTVPRVDRTNRIICSCGHKGYIVVPLLCRACRTPWKFVYAPYVGHPGKSMVPLKGCTDSQLLDLITIGNCTLTSLHEEQMLDIIFAELASRY